MNLHRTHQRAITITETIEDLSVHVNAEWMYKDFPFRVWWAVYMKETDPEYQPGQFKAYLDAGMLRENTSEILKILGEILNPEDWVHDVERSSFYFKRVHHVLAAKGALVGIWCD